MRRSNFTSEWSPRQRAHLMRGPIVLASLAAALFIGHATTKIVPPAEQPAPAVAALERAVAPETLGSAPSESAPVPPPVSPPVSWGLQPRPISTKAAFAYAKNHPATPLSEASFAALANLDGQRELAFAPVVEDDDLTAGQLQTLSRNGLCSAIVAVARANDLPIPFFANLIWQESSFRSKTISSAGALGIAQFIPETAIEHGLMNPFEPIHALFASGKLLRKLHLQFGNLGLAAAAYTAGPGRIYDWMGARRGLPGETRAYVARITGHRADQWLSRQFVREAEALLMPARAPCPEVAEAVKEQAHFVRVAKLMSELVAATAPPAPPDRTPTAALPANRAVALNSAAKPSANKQKKTVTAPGPAKLAAAKPATGSKPQSKPQVNVASAMKDQGRPQSAQNRSKPTAMAANAAA